MKTLICLLACSIFWSMSAPSVSHAKPLESRPADYEKPCLEKGDANRCFELGYKFMNMKGKNAANTKRLARYYFRAGCKAKMGKATCSAEEAKYAARDFNQERAIASPKPATKFDKAKK